MPCGRLDADRPTIAHIERHYRHNLSEALEMKSCSVCKLSSLTILGLFAGAAMAQQQLVATHQDVQVPLGGHVPRWTNNRLAGCDQCEGVPILYSADRLGARQTVVLDIAGAGFTNTGWGFANTGADFISTGAGFTNIRDVAAGSDGSLAAVGIATSGDSRMGTFVAWIAPDRSRQVITRVWPYSPQALAVAPDGTIWTVGAVMNDNYRQVYPNVLRHYAPSGQLLASTIVERAKKSDTDMYNVSETSALMASNDRIGWLTTACQYIEFSFSSMELGRYACPNGYSKISQVGGVALSPANNLLVGGQNTPAPLAPLELDRVTNTWKVVPVLQDSGKTIELLGFDGLTLVTRTGGPMLRRYSLSE